jgi:hypothetical protein
MDHPVAEAPLVDEREPYRARVRKRRCPATYDDSRDEDADLVDQLGLERLMKGCTSASGSAQPKLPSASAT